MDRTLAQEVKIIVYHVNAHTKKKDEMHKNNEIADNLAALATNIKIQRQYKIEDIGPLKKKIRTQYQLVQPETDKDVSENEIQQLHRELGHVGAHALKQWFDERHIKVRWHTVKNVIKKCINCPATITRFTHNYKGCIGHKLHFNKIVQIDFIGPLNGFRNAYACTMVDITTGLGMAKSGPKPDQQTCIMSILQWCAAFGVPETIQSDQGTHFTGKQTPKTAALYNIMWDFHKAYNPTAAGAIERFNGLLKIKLQHLTHLPIQKALNIAIIELNNRPRLHRQSPLEEAKKLKVVIDFPAQEDTNLLRPYTCIYRNKKNNSLKRAEIVAQGTGNNAWITQGKKDLQLVTLESLA